MTHAHENLGSVRCSCPDTQKNRASRQTPAGYMQSERVKKTTITTEKNNRGNCSWFPLHPAPSHQSHFHQFASKPPTNTSAPEKKMFLVFNLLAPWLPLNCLGAEAPAVKSLGEGVPVSGFEAEGTATGGADPSASTETAPAYQNGRRKD